MPPIGRTGGFDKGSAQRIAAQTRLAERNAINGSGQRRRRNYGVAKSEGQLLGVLDDTLLFGESVDVSIWEFEVATQAEADTGATETARDWLLEEGMQLDGGSHVVLSKIGGRWYVTASRECPVDQPEEEE